MADVEKTCTVAIPLDTLTRIKSIALKHLEKTKEQITHGEIITRAIASYEREELSRKIDLDRKEVKS